MLARYRSAIALSYDPRHQTGARHAPTLQAKGDQSMADEMVQLARRYGIPVVEDARLSQALEQIPLDEQIPPELYQAVALMLQQLDSRLGKRGRW